MIAIIYAVGSERGRGPLEEWFTQEGKEERPEKWQKAEKEGLRCVIIPGKCQGHDAVLVQTGIRRTGLRGCKGNTQAREVAEYVVEKYKPEKILIFGTSGGMQTNLNTGHIVVCKPIYAEARCPVWPHWTRIKPPVRPGPDEQLTSLAIEVLKERNASFSVGGDLQTSGHYWPSPQKHPKILVVEMEDYFIALVAAFRNIPFLAIRGIAETFPERLRLELYPNVATIIRNEFLLPFLQRL